MVHIVCVFHNGEGGREKDAQKEERKKIYPLRKGQSPKSGRGVVFVVRRCAVVECGRKCDDGVFPVATGPPRQPEKVVVCRWKRKRTW